MKTCKIISLTIGLFLLLFLNGCKKEEEKETLSYPSVLELSQFAIDNTFYASVKGTFVKKEIEENRLYMAWENSNDDSFNRIVFWLRLSKYDKLDQVEAKSVTINNGKKYQSNKSNDNFIFNVNITLSNGNINMEFTKTKIDKVDFKYKIPINLKAKYSEYDGVTPEKKYLIYKIGNDYYSKMVQKTLDDDNQIINKTVEEIFYRFDKNNKNWTLFEKDKDNEWVESKKVNDLLEIERNIFSYMVFYYDINGLEEKGSKLFLGRKVIHYSNDSVDLWKCDELGLVFIYKTEMIEYEMTLFTSQINNFEDVELPKYNVNLPYV